MKTRTDLIIDDLFFYKPEEDPEYLDYLERQKALSSSGASDRYNCLPCGKVNLSKEYFDMHLIGKAHKLKMAECKSKSTDTSSGSKNSKSADTLGGTKNSKSADTSAGSNNKNYKPTKTSSDSTCKSRNVLTADASNETSADVSSEASVPRSRPRSTFAEFDSCIAYSDVIYSCKICEIEIKQKRNVKPHMKSKRHIQQAKEVVTMRDESVTGKGELNEVGFARDTANPRPGCHFLLEFKRPIKYKLARLLMKMACSCSLCLKAFRSSELFSRLRSTQEHKNKLKLEKRKRRLWNKPVAGGEITHGQLIEQIYERYPGFLSKNRPKLMKKKGEKQQSFINKAAICNEFGSSRIKHSHSHMYCQTEEKFTFKKIRKLFYKRFRVRIADIRRPVNFRECVRYVTKEDKQAVILNIPMKFTSTLYRGYRYFNECSSSGVLYGDFIPSTVAACDRKVFESVVGYEGRLQDARYIHDRVMSLELLLWQEDLVNVLNNVRNSDRAIVWVVDILGGAGKSVMCQWLLSQGSFGKGILFQDFDYRTNSYLYNSEGLEMFDIPRTASPTDLRFIEDIKNGTNSYLYNSEGLVMFDIPRTASPTDLRFIEDIKNGYLISTKYECRQKIFPSPVVVVFSNDYHEKSLLSIDRWSVYSIHDEVNDGRRTGVLIHHPEFNL